MKIERLIEMANDIANFFRTEPNHDEAVKGIADHIWKFWEPRMRKEILAYLDKGHDNLDPLVNEALSLLKEKQDKTEAA
jgi:formate dehydrogenase subunit delta